MSIIKEKPNRKTVIRGERSINIDTFETAIVSDEFYSTNGELLIIVRRKGGHRRFPLHLLTYLDHLHQMVDH
jgi:hypothetical protein